MKPPTFHQTQEPDRFDNDRIDADHGSSTLAAHETRVELRRKQAAIRTELMRRQRGRPAPGQRPESAF